MVDFSSIGRRVATQAVNNGLQKVAGNVRGLLSGGNKGADSSDTSPLNTRNTDYKTYEFPLDVTAGPGIGNHGHYIMFFVNEHKHATLRFDGGVKKNKDGGDLMRETMKRVIPEFQKKTVVDTKSGELRSKVVLEKAARTSHLQNQINSVTRNGNTHAASTIEGLAMAAAVQGPQVEGESTVSVKSPATKRLDTAIALYMPAALNVTYGSRYVDTEISPLGRSAGAIGADALRRLEGGAVGPENTTGQGFFESAVKELRQTAGQEFDRRAILTALAGADLIGATGAREAFEINRAEVVTDRMELAFKNVNRRVFTYTFKLIPKNEKEADEIRKIIYAFKFNMLPEVKGGRTGNTLQFPNTFDIEYRFLGKDNDYVNRVSTCVLETMNVTYGGDRFKTFAPRSDGAPVVETNLTLNFKELELITRERVAEGY